MKKLVTLFLLSAIGIAQGYSQKETQIKIQERLINQSLSQEKITSSENFTIKETIYDFTAKTKTTEAGEYIEILTDGLLKTFDAGSPDLPVFAKLIEIPVNHTVKINIINYKEKQISFSDYNIKNKIIPAQESVSKSDDPEKVPFKIKNEIYLKNSFYKPEFVKFEDRGYLRNKHLGYLQISPFEYNPVTNILIVKYDFEIEVQFISDNKSAMIIDQRLQSPYFDNLPLPTVNTTSDTKALVQGPVKYVIVSNIMFQSTLQPFIEWKKMKGFNVVEAYTNNPAVGSTSTSIKAYLKGLYDTPADGVAPTFVLLVGDVAQIPASSTSGHYSDLYYYTLTVGDNLPDVFGGRFSASTTAQLQSQIDKTLQVEKYLMPNPSYLNNVVLVAGVDAGAAPTYGNGFVNYANAYYTNSANGINSLSYKYPESGSADETIRANISSGVALANYTAHCSSSGWSDPTFSTSQIPLMTNINKYPLMIGNCCQSVMFGGDCFGEEIVRAVNKGAVGYIGASDYTYWDEDYYWAIGVAPISANPTYAGSGLGAYDRFFHLNGEAKSDWFITQGQMNVAGNIAVEASTSGRKLYYWEIYHLMGDPSLTPYVKVPSILFSSHNSEMIIGSSSFSVTTEEDAFVALSFNGVLLNSKIAGSGGLVELSFSSLTEVGIAKLVITKQNRIPKIVDITIIPATTPYVIKDEIVIHDELGNNNNMLDFSETIKLSVQLKNVSKLFDALSVEAKLFTSDSNIVVSDSLESYGTILKDTVSNKENVYQFQLKNNVPDQHPLQLNFSVTGTDADLNPYTWLSKATYIINAPLLKIDEFIIDDSGFNGNEILDPGETVILKWIIENKGHAPISGLTGLLEYASGSTLLTIDQSTTDSFSLASGTKDTIIFIVTASALEQFETPIELKVSLVDNLFNSYTVSKNETIIIGDLPEYKISEGGKITLFHAALFYDSGGPLASYANNENYTLTFLPEQNKGYLKIKFNSFDVEKRDEGGCWDKLYIYNDTIVNDSKKIGEFCSQNPPTEYTASNTSGALTFKFTSDVSIVKSGWEARVTLVKNFNVNFIVTASGNALENALVSFNNQEKLTNNLGEAIFENITYNAQLNFEIRKNGFENYSGTINVTSDTTITIELTEGTAWYNSTFNVTDGANPVSGATILFDGLEGITDANGTYTFDSIEQGLNKKYTITKDTYFQHIDSVDVDTNLALNITLKLITYSVTFQVTSNENSGPLEGVSVNFNSDIETTNTNGLAVFSNIEPKSGIVYTLTKEGYIPVSGNMDIIDENKTMNFAMSVISAVNKLTSESIAIFPNPSQGLLNIDFGYLTKGNVQIDIFDILGKSVFKKELLIIENTNEIIDFTNQAKGIYFISIKFSTGEHFSRKIIIK